MRPMLSFFIRVLSCKFEKIARHLGGAPPAITESLFPSMRFPDRYHRLQNGVPGFLFQHHFVGEHATIPANVLEGLRQFPLVVPKPVAGGLCNIQLSVWIIGQTVAPRLVM